MNLNLNKVPYDEKPPQKLCHQISKTFLEHKKLQFLLPKTFSKLSDLLGEKEMVVPRKWRMKKEMYQINTNK